jgi:putative heme-binding domain-containing protein
MFNTKEYCLRRVSFSRKGGIVLALAGAGLAGLLATTMVVGADDKNPFAGDAKAAKLGEFQFRINCAFCHGLSGRGGGRGPDLTKAQKRHGNADADLFRTISQGVPGTAMPAGVNGGIGVGMTEEEIWQVITYLRSVQVKAPEKPVGDAAHGKELFYGSARCGTCHVVEGKGGRLGPDLTMAGSVRSADSLVDSVRNPSRRLASGIKEAAKEFPQEYETVTVTTPDGKKITGVTMNEDNFSLQMMDADEKIHLFEKDKLKSFEKSRESLMPPYDAKMLSDKDLNDLVAYLLSVGAK